MADKRSVYIIEVAQYCGLDADLILELIEQDILHPSPDLEDNFFTPKDITLLRRIRRLSHDMGVNPAGIEVILHMRERIISLQDQLQKRQYSFLEDNEDFEEL